MKTKSDILIIGGGGHSKVVVSIIQKMNEYNIIGYTDIQDKGPILGIKYLGNDGILKCLITDHPNCQAVLGLGMIQINERRIKVMEKIKNLGFTFPCIISPIATINTKVSIGEGTVIFDNAIINCQTQVGKFCIINTNSVIEHDCQIGDNVFIGPNATVCGEVTIGNNSFIGAGSTIIQSIKISSNSLIGAGSVVVNNCEIPGTYVGTPVKKL